MIHHRSGFMLERTWTRRGVLKTAVASLAALGTAQIAWPQRGLAAEKNIDADEALARLMAGNARYVSGALERPNQSAARRSEVAKGQLPFATILSCVDSRVPPELVFDQGLGDLFVLRVAGNVLNDEIIGSIEFGAEEFGIPLVVVLGHENCGAVAAAVDVVTKGGHAPGHIESLVQAIRPAVQESQAVDAARSGLGATPPSQVEVAVRANVGIQVDALKHSEPIVAELLHDGKIKIVGMRYGLGTGAVEIIA